MLLGVNIAIVFLAVFLVTSNGLIANFGVIDEGTYANMMAKSFGMAAGGVIELTYDIHALNATGPSNSYFLLFVITEAQLFGWYSGNLQATNTICNQPSLFRQRVYGSGNVTYTTTNTDRFSVLVAQCRSSPSSNKVAANVQLSMKNPLPGTTSYSHLSIQYVNELRVLEGELIIYSLLLLGIVGQYYFMKPWFRKIHGLFALTLLMLLFSLAASYEAYRYENMNGEDSYSLDQFASLINFASVFTTLATLLFLSLGWTTVRVFFSSKERNLIASCLGTYFILGLASAVCIDDTETCRALSLTSYVLKCVVFLGIIIAMNFTVTQLRAMLLHSPWAPSVSVQYARAQQFQQFRFIFILYLLLPSIFLLIQATVFSWKEQWVLYAMNETLQLLMILHVGITFGPMNEQSLLRAFGTFNTGRARAE